MVNFMANICIIIICNACFSLLIYFQGKFPLRFRQFHLVNCSYFTRIGYNLIRPFLHDELKKRIIFHDEIDSFHGYVDKQILPEEFGGALGPINNSAASSAVYEMSNFFVQVQNYVNQNSNV